MNTFAEGEVIEFEYPFSRDTYTEMDEDGFAEAPTWRPGVRHENVPPEGDTDTFADGLGKQIITIIGIYKPGKFPTRIFFTRKWMDPDGKTFGKNALRVYSIAAFQTLISGYRHQYRLQESKAA